MNAYEQVCKHMSESVKYRLRAQFQQQNKLYTTDKFKTEDSRRNVDFYILYIFYIYTEYSLRVVLAQLHQLASLTF